MVQPEGKRTSQAANWEAGTAMFSETSNQSELNVVTGAFGYTGKYIAL